LGTTSKCTYKTKRVYVKAQSFLLDHIRK